ncbi:MAG TPA: aldolase/citrate lyase family protein [Terriglobia bacterium]|nr:aldolase/citrate lyase family protein [Terriglobia bacterium]
MSRMSLKDAELEPALENPVKKLLREGKPVLGLTITVPSVEVAAQAANLGFDFLWIEMEHSPITLETLRNMVLATRGLKAVPFARVPVNELWTAKRVLDSGVLGVIFPFTSTPELARRAVAACKYPPHGGRGSGAGLATFRWPAPEGYHDFADRNVLVIVNIEEAEAVENIDAIASTPGVDVLFIGTNDLSFSLGFRGEQDHPEVREAIAKVVKAARKHHKVAGAPVGNPDLMKKYLEQGFLFFQASTELGLMAAGSRQFLEPVGKLLTKPKSKSLY